MSNETMKDGERALKACPFCGAAASIGKVARDWWRISADHDDNCALDSDHRLDAPHTPEGRAWIVAAWNNRAAAPQAGALTDEQIEEIAKEFRQTCADIVMVDVFDAVSFARTLLAAAQGANS